MVQVLSRSLFIVSVRNPLQHKLFAPVNGSNDDGKSNEHDNSNNNDNSNGIRNGDEYPHLSNNTGSSGNNTNNDSNSSRNTSNNDDLHTCTHVRTPLSRRDGQDDDKPNMDLKETRGASNHSRPTPTPNTTIV